MAQVDYFLKVKGIEGESKDAKHKNEIDIMSWSWGHQNSGTAGKGTGRGAGKVVMNDFSFTTTVNKSSAKLMLACANGDHIGEATLVCRKAGKDQHEYLKYKFTDLLVSSYQTGGGGGENVIPVDSFTFNFAKVEYEYYPQTEKGTLGSKVPWHWDQETNTGG